MKKSYIDIFHIKPIFQYLTNLFNKKNTTVASTVAAHTICMCFKNYFI